MTYRPLRGLSAPLRTYPTALAEQLAACRPGEVRLKLLNDLYLRLDLGDRLACLTALESVRRARRIEMLRAGCVVRLPDRVLL